MRAAKGTPATTATTPTPATTPTHGDHAHSGGSDMAQAMAQTPDWATAVNWVAIALSALAAVWWLLLLVRSRRIGIHTLCHAVMGLGMAGMLALM
jgi:hypothetical protein